MERSEHLFNDNLFFEGFSTHTHLIGQNLHTSKILAYYLLIIHLQHFVLSSQILEPDLLQLVRTCIRLCNNFPCLLGRCSGSYLLEIDCIHTLMYKEKGFTITFLELLEHLSSRISSSSECTICCSSSCPESTYALEKLRFRLLKPSFLRRDRLGSHQPSALDTIVSLEQERISNRDESLIDE